jgi:hypothetical protein
MARASRVCIAIALGSALGAGRAAAADATLGAAVDSAHVWRGVTLNATPVLVPELSVTGLKLYGASLRTRVCGHLNVGDEGGLLPARKLSALELEAGLELPYGYTLSYIEYAFPTAIGLREVRPNEPARKSYLSTREVALSWRPRGSLVPHVTVYRDVGEIRDFFVELGLDHGFALSENARLDLAAAVTYAGVRYARDHGATREGLHDYELRSRLTYHPLKALKLTLRSAYTRGFDRALPNQPVHFYCSLGASVSY